MPQMVLEDYRPSEDEPFMNARQQEYFRGKLQAWKEEILEESRSTIASLQQDTVAEADALVESLAWLRGAATPNREVRKLFDCYAVVRAALHRQGEQKEQGWTDRVGK